MQAQDFCIQVLGDKGYCDLGCEEKKQSGGVKMPSCRCTSKEPILIEQQTGVWQRGIEGLGLVS